MTAAAPTPDEAMAESARLLREAEAKPHDADHLTYLAEHWADLGDRIAKWTL